MKEKEKLVIPALLHFELDDPGSMSVMAMLRQSGDHVVRKGRATAMLVTFPVGVSGPKAQSVRNLIEVRQVAKDPQGCRIREIVVLLVRL